MGTEIQSVYMYNTHKLLTSVLAQVVLLSSCYNTYKRNL